MISKNITILSEWTAAHSIPVVAVSFTYTAFSAASDMEGANIEAE